MSKLENTIKDVNKKYGTKTATTVDEKESTVVKFFTSECFSFDRVFGCGGIPQARIIEIYGNFGEGKSTMAMFITAQVQKQSKRKCVWVDTEAVFTSEYAQKVGVNTKELILIQPDDGEMALDVVEQFIKSKEVDLIVVDSTAALVPRAEIEKGIDEATIALQAKLLAKGLRKIVYPAFQNGTTVIFISQMRDKIGTFFGPQSQSTGGKSLKFAASVRLEVKKIKTLKEGDEVIGNRLRIIASKNKVGIPFRSADIDLYFKKGLDVIGDIVDVAVKENIIERVGTTYSFDGKKLAVGRDATRNYLEEHKEIFEKIKKQLNENL